MTVFSATVFSFCALFALVGLLTLLLPANWLRPVSVVVRVFLAVVLMVEFFSNFFLQLFSGHLPAYASAYLNGYRRSGSSESTKPVVGIAPPLMHAMAARALSALGMAVAMTIVSYTLCYKRHFLRLSESFDTLAGNQHGAWLKMPEWLGRLLFRTPFEEACLLFVFRVMTRSERHVMFLGGYLGVGLVVVVQSAAASLLLLRFF